MDVERVKRVGRAIVYEMRVEKIPFLAGSLAYHAFLSLLPLFALLLYIATGLGDENLEQGLILLSRAVFTEGAQEVLLAEMRDASGSAGLSVLGVGVLIWGTLRIFRGLDTAFSDIYETEEHNSFLDQVRDGVIVLGCFGLAVLVSLLIYDALPNGGVLSFLRPVALIGGLTLAMLPMYYVFPDTDVSVKEILPGAVLASLGLTVFQVIFQIYLASGEQNVLGGIILLLTWLYAGGLLILVGVVVNAVLSNRSTDVSIQPVFGGVRPVDQSGNWTVEELRHALSTFDDRISTRTPFTVSVDGDPIEFPPPARVEVGSDESPTLTLRWNPRGPVFDDIATESEPPADPEAGTDATVEGSIPHGDGGEN